VDLGAAISGVDRGDEEPDACVLLDRFRAFADSSYGVVTCSEEEQDYFHDEPKWPLWRAEIAPTRPLDAGGYLSTVANGGRGFDLARAEVSGLFEAFERYSLSLHGTPTTVRASDAELERDGRARLAVREFADTWEAVDPEEEKERSRNWVVGRDPGGRPVLVPAQFVHVPYFPSPEEPLLRDPLTTGTAAGLRVGAAAARALLELVERDGIMRWHYGVSPARAVTESHVRDEGLRRQLRDLARHRLEWRAVRIDSGLPVHVVAVCVTDPSGLRPVFTLGTCARLSLGEALRGALEEAVIYRRGLRGTLPPVTQPLEGISPRDVRCLTDRSHYWQQDALVDRIGYLDWDATPVEDATAATNFRFSPLLDAVASRGPLAWVDVAAPELSAAGVRVVKIISPQLQPMHLNEDLECVVADVSAVMAEKPGLPHPFL
jgi:thiazole/oxazole-forming peptide maturase SagD family component